MATPKEHIEQIRKTKFSIGGEPNPLTEDLHQAVRNLSAELYTKDVHFLMELIQNAEDNEYVEGVDPSLEFVITTRDITATGAPATLLMFNNEKGFSSKNIESICSVGRSTKKGNRKRGYIGEKGIGFKSVFLISAQPYIFSNGYQIRFNEAPCPHCSLGYIVPEWVDENPTLSGIRKVYGSSYALPTTTIVLPLKPDKVKPVKQQLSSVHPEVLLFLSKIKCLSVREDNEDPRLDTISAIAITSETNFVTRKNIDAESYTLCLSAEEKGDEFGRECSYYMWKQKFPVRQENKVERRMDIEELVITLAFPNEERRRRGTILPGVYAFLPTEMVTNLPFIIQADFVLSSSRETILLDNKWNQGILDCVPTAFVNAFISLVKMTEDAPVSSLPRMFTFLPVNNSSYQSFDAIRESIRLKLVGEDILPSDESCTEQKFFHKPREVGRIMPAFRDIVEKARKEGVGLHNLSSRRTYVLHSSFDVVKYDYILEFLGVRPVNPEWYAKCIQSSDLVLGVSEGIYLELLVFLAENWQNMFHGTNIMNIPLVKYVDPCGSVSLCSIGDSRRQSQGAICWSHKFRSISWLIDWNREFTGVANHFFLPESTQKAIRSCFSKEKILEWLRNQVRVVPISVQEYAAALINHLGSKPKPVVTYAHFLYHSSLMNFVAAKEVVSLCGMMPLVDNYGNVIATRNRGILVPANGSKWASLIGSNPLKAGAYIELGEDYLRPGNFAGQFTPKKKLMEFLGTHAAALDIPSLPPPNAAIPAVSSPLTKENTFLLLDWIQHMKNRGTPIPKKFLRSIKYRNWLKVTINGSYGYKPPSQSFFYSASWGNILQNESVFVDIPLIDQNFYGDKISMYREELKTIGVMFEYGEACEFIGKHLMRLASSSMLSKDRMLSILDLIRYLRTKFLPPDALISSIKEEAWLKTSHDYRSPEGAALFDEEWKIAEQICDVPFIDQAFYGDQILGFKEELQLLGVIVGFSGSYQLVTENLKSSSCLTSLKADAFLLLLECMRHAKSSKSLVTTLKDAKCLKTNFGYKSPSECFLFDHEWGCLLQVFSGFPIIEQAYYCCSFSSYKNELRSLGAVVDFDSAVKSFASCLRQQALSSSVTKDNVLSFLSCYRQLKTMSHKFPSDLKNCIREEKWLRTRLGDFRSPRDCILFGPKWESISQIALLPFIDDSDNCYGKDIHEYREELKSIGVVVEFESGVKFVPSCLCFPQRTHSVAPTNALSLLECMRILLEVKDYSFSEAFQKEVSKKWLKTYAGYMSPGNSLLFDESSDLKLTDGPFIDEGFYGSEIRMYRKELNSIGVTVDVKKGSTLLASHLDFHSDFATIIRIYKFLEKAKWEPDSEATRKIWIPDGNENGRWVKPDVCVLHDKDGLCGLRLNVLEKYYENETLPFFSGTFGVKSNPSLDDYCKLWKVWETSGYQLSHDECCAFWRSVVRHKSSKTERLVKVPVDSGSGRIMLFDKHDVFIADDLQLKDLFVQSSSRPLFVWYPQPSLPSLPRTVLFELYRKIGVRTISEAVQKKELSLTNGLELKQVNLRDVMIGKELVRLVLGFLAGSSMKMEADKRHEVIQCLLNLTVLETFEPVAVRYTLLLSSGETEEVRASQMIRWDKGSSKFFTQKMNESAGQKNLLEYATDFSNAIAEGVLWEKEDQITSLSELIKLAFLLKFNGEAVGFLMKSKNLQVFVEDEEFLSAAFPNE